MAQDIVIVDLKGEPGLARQLGDDPFSREPQQIHAAVEERTQRNPDFCPSRRDPEGALTHFDMGYRGHSEVCSRRRAY